MESEVSIEKPLSSASKATLMCAAGATILFFYVLALLCVILLSVLILFEILILIVLLRFGLAGVMAGMVERHGHLIVLFFKSFWLEKGADGNITLQPEDAPELFAILKRLCTRLSVTEPRIVSLMMGVNAWVRLKGYWRGSGKTTLGIGFDLVAGLSVREVEAVLAHEMVHAKLIQRGFKNWLSSGLARVTKLTNMLSAWTEAYRKANQTFELAEFLLRGADILTKRAAQLVAKYSRQDEFEADHGAAEICGSIPLRTSLLKLESLEKIAARLPWQERVAHLEMNAGYGSWLAEELARAQSLPHPETDKELFNKYATHPLLRDRLAALPPATEDIGGNQTPAISLLANPDKVAEKLIAQIQRLLAEQEKKDSKELNAWARKAQRRQNTGALQVLGFIICLITGIAGLGYLLTNGWSFIALLAIFAAGSTGVWVFRLGRYRDRVVLPIPDYAMLKQAWKKSAEFVLEDAKQKSLEAELKVIGEKETKWRKRAPIYAAEAYAALRQCDYTRAYAAARLCFVANDKSVEGMLAFAIASAAVQKGDQAVRTINRVQAATGLKSPSTLWGAAWTLMLLGDWAGAEAFLEEAIRSNPLEPTLLILQSICQSSRNKLQSAILRARRSCDTGFGGIENSKFLIDLLLKGGYVREARERLLPLETAARTDAELAFSMTRLNVLQRNFTAAEEWTAIMRQNSIKPKILVRLGEAYEHMRCDDKAESFYAEALAAGFYPEACLGLGRLQFHRDNKAEAREHFLKALNLDQKLGDEAAGPLPLFHKVLDNLLRLEEPALNCQAWIATFTDSNPIQALRHHSVMVFAHTQENADTYVAAILKAMQPEKPPPLPTAIRWQNAPHQHQPDGPVLPGIQGVMN